MMDKDEVLRLYEANCLAEAASLLEGGEDPWSLFMLGRIAWKQGRRSEAMGLYGRAASLDPSGPASVALEQARTIMSFYNKDLYNP